MLRMILVAFLYGAGGLWGLTHVVRAYCLLIWNDIFRPAHWAREYGILNNATFPSHKYCWFVFGVATVVPRWEKRWNFGAAAIALLMIWMWVCCVLSPFRDVAEDAATQATKYLLPAFIASIALVDRGKQLIILYVLAFSVGIWSAWAGFHSTVIRGNIETTMFIPHGQMTDRNDFLAGVTAAVPLLAYIGWHDESRFRRFLRPATKALLALSLLAFVMSHSRGAIVGLAGLGVFYSLFTGRFLKRTSIALVVAVLIVAVTPESTWRRMSTIEIGTEQTESSARTRMEHMRTAVKVTADHPFSGVGPGAFPPASMKYSEYGDDPHSIWLKCSSEYGLVGLAGFVLAIFLMTKRLLRVARAARIRGDTKTDAFATAICCAYIGFLLTGSFLSQFLSEYFWAIFGLGGAFVASEYAKERAQRAAEDARRRAPGESQRESGGRVPV